MSCQLPVVWLVERTKCDGGCRALSNGIQSFVLIFDIFGLICTKLCRDDFHRSRMELCELHASQLLKCDVQC
jgi:hypothetical protein